MNDQKTQRFYRWSLAGGWVVLIYSTLYIVRPICEFLKQAASFSLLVKGGVGLLLVGLMAVLFKRIGAFRVSSCFLLAVALGLYVLAISLLPTPEESLHLVEYGILSFFVYWAFILDFKNWQAYLGAFVLTSLLGWGDEGIQYLLPNRYYQTKDVLLNSVSAALGLFLVFTVERERAFCGKS